MSLLKPLPSYLINYPRKLPKNLAVGMIRKGLIEVARLGVVVSSGFVVGLLELATALPAFVAALVGLVAACFVFVPIE